MNNHTTARLPLRASETVDVLTQQILGLIARDGHGQFYAVKQPPLEGEMASDMYELYRLLEGP